MTTLDVLMSHGSRNEIFLVDGTWQQYFGTPEERIEFVRRMNDRSGPAGGGDGLYFIDDSGEIPDVGFYNADGSPSQLCGNGLRCVMRLLMDRRGVEKLTVRIGANLFDGYRAPDIAPGVPAVALDLPPATFAPPQLPLHTGAAEHVDAPLPQLHPTLRFTALAVPNPHLVAVMDAYDEDLLVDLGMRVAAGIDVLPEGVNVSFVVPLGDDDLFVRTYERGSAMTPACGSANVASRTAYSRLGLAPADRRIAVRNVGGVAYSWDSAEAGTSVGTAPVLEGNGTYVYRAEVHLGDLMSGAHRPLERRWFDEELAAYAAFSDGNHQVLAGAGIPLPEA